MKPLRHTFKVQTSKETLFNLGNFCVSSDGKYLICVFSNLVNVVEIETGLVKHTLESEEEEISSVALSPNDEHLITAHFTSLLLKQWSNWKQFPSDAATKTQKCTRTWKAVHTSPILSMSFDSSSTLLATSSSDYTTKVWDLNAQYCTHNLKGVGGITRCARFFPDVRRKQEIVLGGDDAKLRVYDLNTSRVIALLDGHFSVVTCFEYLGDKSERLLSASRDKVLILWDMTTFSKLRTIPTFEPIESLELLPGVADYVLTMGNAGVIKLWNIESGRLAYTQDESQSVKSSSSSSSSSSTDLEPCIMQSKWIKSANSVVMLTVDESIVFVRVDAALMAKLAKDEQFSLSSDELKRFFNPYKQYIGNHGEILDAKFVDSHERLLAVATNSSDLKIYDLDNWDCKVLKGHKDLIICLAVYKDRANKKSYLASSSKDSEIRIWQISTNSSSERPPLSSYRFEVLQVCMGHTQDVGALAFSKHSFDFLVSGSIDTTIKLWRVSDASKSSKKQFSVAFTAKAHEKDINCVCVSSNDKLIASGSTDKTAKIWDSNDGSCLAVLRGHRRGIWSVEFSSLEQLVATCSADATIKLWTLTDYSCIKTFEGHNTSVLKVFFLNQSSQLISCASDGLIKLWNIKTSGCVASFDQHDDKCWSLVLSDNEERIISGGADGKLIVWRDVTDEMLAEELEEREEVLLKEQELENFMQEKNWKKALRLALVLDKPFRCYSIIKEILEMRNVDLKDGVNLGRLTLEKTLKSLREDQIRSLLKYASEWNTNTRYCRLAQVVFELIMRNFSPELITQDGTNNDFAKQIVEQFLPYTERHGARLNRLAQQVMFIDFVWKNMKLDDSETQNKQISNHNNNILSINQ